MVNIQETPISKLVPIVYIAGPYTADSYRGVDFNIEIARKAAVFLARHRIAYICPHLNSAHFDTALPTIPYSYWTNMYLELLRRCDAILLVGYWRNSKGTQVEIAEAERCGIPVLHKPAEALKWYNERIKGEATV